MGSGRSGIYSRTHGSQQRAFPGSTDYMDPADSFSKYIKGRRDIDANGFYDVIAHGNPNSILIERNGVRYEVNHRTTSKLLKRDNGYKGGNIRLLSCNTGSSVHGFAQNLANKLNVVVEAPTKLVWVQTDGSYFVAGRSRADPNLPDLKNRGRFIKFYPGGRKR